jgi:methylglyoxal synthase
MLPSRYVLAVLVLIVTTLFANSPTRADSFTTGCTYNITAVASAFFSLANTTPTGEIDNNQQGTPSSCAAFGASVTANATDIIVGSSGDSGSFTQAVTTTVSGSIAPGDIGLAATVSASSTPESYFYIDPTTDQPYAINNGEIAGGIATASAGYADYFTINGPADGIPVTLEFTPSFDISLTTTPGSQQAGGTDELEVFGSTTGFVALSAPGQQTLDFSTMTGTTIEVIDSVNVNTQACAGGPLCGDTYTASATATADASRTAALSVVDLTPGTSFNTASGYSYAPVSPPPTTVPEPSSFLCLLGGTVFLLVRHLRRDALR